jgi:hypothetical protein
MIIIRLHKRDIFTIYLRAKIALVDWEHQIPVSPFFDCFAAHHGEVDMFS